MNALPASWHAPIARQPRDSYGQQMLDATEPIVAAVQARDRHALRTAIDRALTIPQPAGEDPVVWLAGALAAQINPAVPLAQRIPWTENAA
ncbi:hypothetical protein [Pseudonocardia parietis]|uniref:Uncharacterized protein n=1 Tax=Pseudonocardia parietis TaxID=570936 RepID=A0ABS4W236_9PSEU|nr:hypothetical protein [Pseudonocardia parietis]MBP2370260.1 hypothetical protein [Pseudonocardia parietis]